MMQATPESVSVMDRPVSAATLTQQSNLRDRPIEILSTAGVAGGVIINDCSGGSQGRINYPRALTLARALAATLGGTVAARATTDRDTVNVVVGGVPALLAVELGHIRLTDAGNYELTVIEILDAPEVKRAAIQNSPFQGILRKPSLCGGILKFGAQRGGGSGARDGEYASGECSWHLHPDQRHAWRIGRVLNRVDFSSVP